MPCKTLILGASYGALFGMKLASAGHDATLVCRPATAALINGDGTEVRIRPRGETRLHRIFSATLPGRTDAAIPADAHPERYDLICLAMQEPQYSDPEIAALLARIARSRVPCISIMNMPPLPYLRRIPALARADLDGAYHDPAVWAPFDPALMTLCSPDPQAFRPADEAPNVLQVGLPTNFKLSRFGAAGPDAMLRKVATGIDLTRIAGYEIPVRLRLFDSPFVPFAKWAMLAAGNYRCITEGAPRAIRDAVHGAPEEARAIYDFVNEMVVRLGAAPGDLVPFERYAAAAKGLEKPSSAARAIEGGAERIERVDRLIARVAAALEMSHPALDRTVALIDARLEQNRTALVG